MTIYAIGDLHMDAKNEKPMSVFGENWENHEEKIFSDWKEKVLDKDIVLIPGDISWAMHLSDAKEDLKKINDLPGKKLMIKGNHDYWWHSLSKLNELKLNEIYFIQNIAFEIDNIGFCGTRGWTADETEEKSEHNDKMIKRELNRLELSLKNIRKSNFKIVMLHYPPFKYDGTDTLFIDLMKKYNVNICLYGHLHGEGHKYIKEGSYDGIEYHCVSADYIDFKLKKIK